jgi:hypothetical protein
VKLSFYRTLDCEVQYIRMLLNISSFVSSTSASLQNPLHTHLSLFIGNRLSVSTGSLLLGILLNNIGRDVSRSNSLLSDMHLWHPSMPRYILITFLASIIVSTPSLSRDATHCFSTFQGLFKTITTTTTSILLP